jgi:protein SCO1
MKHRFLLLVAAMSVAISTGNRARAGDAGQTTNQVFNARGVVREISPDRTKAVIRHEVIPDYMPAMTMEFNMRDTNELGGLRTGDAITFRLTVTDGTHWIDMVRKTGAATNYSADSSTRLTAPNIRELKPGDQLPDCKLLAENGKPIYFSDFRGKAIAFTFFFTRCPLPDYCPRMGNNFAKSRELVQATEDAPTNWLFLSISFDPEFDQPAVLSSYANSYRQQDTNGWLFAAAPTSSLAALAPQLDLLVHHEQGGGISHNLRTVVLDPRGKIYWQFDGNEWTPQELARALMEAARLPNRK